MAENPEIVPWETFKTMIDLFPMANIYIPFYYLVNNALFVGVLLFFCQLTASCDKPSACCLKYDTSYTVNYEHSLPHATLPVLFMNVVLKQNFLDI